MNISSNVSSIQAHQTMMNTSANNVANVNTGAFIPSDTRMSSNESSVSANTRKADNTGSKTSQTDLAKEIPNQIIAQDATAVNVTAIKTQDQMLGSLLDIKA
ncbi:flagellar basal body rod C-terminal domain-containing protein [Sulfurimonas sp.]|uniref:flagellar basal body rod C-terminal domain-containing protein n=1 Tax=Sulfurimonas sp. TaxID=2022749 RepID=UPI003564787C